MANSKIADITSAAATTADEIYVNRAGVDKRISVRGVLNRTNTITADATTNYTLVATDAFSVVEMSPTSTATITVPSTSSVSFPDGTWVNFVHKTTVGLSVTTGSGVTVNSRAGRALAGQYAMATIYKSSANSWILGGDLVST